MKDKLLRKLLIEQNVIRTTKDYNCLRCLHTTIENAYYTPQELLTRVERSITGLAGDLQRLLIHLNLEITDVPKRPAMRVIRKKKK